MSPSSSTTERPQLPHQISEGRDKFGQNSHIVYHQETGGEDKVTRIRDLVRAPCVRQWVEGGRLYRESTSREISRFELFFDLLFVAIIHQLADAAIEEPGGPAVARFVLTFWPSWSVWDEARKYSNVSGTDDLLHRTWVLIGMACLLGYSANASSIELHPTDEEVGLDHTAVRAAAAYWLIVKLSRVVVLLYYAYYLPLFRRAQIMMALAVLLPMFLYLPLIWVTSRHAQIILASLGIAVDLIRVDLFVHYIRGRILQWRHGDHDTQAKKIALHKMPDLPNMRIPAMNIEHAIERSSAFVVIVLGELVMNLLYQAGKGDLGASHIYWKAVMGLMVAWALNYLYFLPNEPNNEYEHALRRSWLSGITFNFLHWPLCASLLLASAASGRMVAEDEVELGVHWYWGCGLGFALLCLTAIDWTHGNLAPNSEAIVPRHLRNLTTLSGAISLILFPLGADNLSTIEMMGIAVGIIWFVLIVGVVGMIPRPSIAREWKRQEEHEREQGYDGNGNGNGNLQEKNRDQGQRDQQHQQQQHQYIDRETETETDRQIGTRTRHGQFENGDHQRAHQVGSDQVIPVNI
ncbi:bacterial low temperature requirement A protein-domain-containing protein [Naematelia encephala]|uniref:Bacterial low temperature requirement A protein-domain-containing protein n=1 Tax=Naematelia encephala TaxID=71784 RepID=A0A1Y2B5W1_9TREE|nr:bacterial low temperature requirement A protein-domain-containing protein [Naematelia encephala]